MKYLNKSFVANIEQKRWDYIFGKKEKHAPSTEEQLRRLEETRAGKNCGKYTKMSI